MKKEQKILENLDTCIVTAFGHCGLDWITSLLDSHEEILVMPSFSFFRCFYYIKTWNKNFDFEKNYISNKDIVKEFTRYFKKDKRQNTQRRKFLFNNKHYKIFEHSLLNWLNQSKIKNKYKKLFLGIHYAYSKVHNINLKKKKILVAHEHVPFYSKKYLKIFNSRFIFLLRDPRAAIAGSLLGMEKHNSDKIYSNQFDHIIFEWKWSEKFVNQEVSNSKIYIIKNELMHKNLKKEMSNLSKWLNVSFKKSMLKQTFVGKVWYGESSYLQGKDQESELKKYPPKNFYNPIEVKKRWRSKLTDLEISMIEIILKDIFYKYNYKIIIKKNLFYILKAYFYLFFNYNYQKKYYISKVIIIPRNIIRRLIILINPNLTNIIYKFH